MDIEFDPVKDATNRAKHGLPLADGARVFADDAHIVIPSIREIDGEERFKAVGLIGDKAHTVIYVWRGERMRFISLRRSNDGEKRHYRTAGRPERPG